METEWTSFHSSAHVPSARYLPPCVFYCKIHLRRTVYDMCEVSVENKLESFEARRYSPDPPSIVALLKNADSLYVQSIVILRPI